METETAVALFGVILAIVFLTAIVQNLRARVKNLEQAITIQASAIRNAKNAAWSIDRALNDHIDNHG